MSLSALVPAVSWRDKDKLDVLAVREIIARESH
jgi:hypothetical protein